MEWIVSGRLCVCERGREADGLVFSTMLLAKSAQALSFSLSLLECRWTAGAIAYRSTGRTGKRAREATVRSSNSSSHYLRRQVTATLNRAQDRQLNAGNRSAGEEREREAEHVLSNPLLSLIVAREAQEQKEREREGDSRPASDHSSGLRSLDRIDSCT